MRPEIQALRGIAVLLVLVAHLWPAVLPGGFTGVDVFFAISGYLITSNLIRERPRLSTFWARRARRILPAAFTVLAFTALATIAIVPETSWPRFLAEIRASAFYFENWQLAATSVDYFASTDLPSPVQHYWSLSVEEQFYLVWPLLLLVRPKLAMVAVFAVSLACSVTADPVAGYFQTSTRAWELAAGGLLALAPRRGPSAASWLGLVAIAAAAVLYDEHTPFPGIAAALPVGGALGVLWGRATFAPASLRFLGDISYPVYLWHWPLLILAPFATGRPVDTPTTLTVLMLTILASWLTKTFIEDPIRHGRLRPGVTFACAGAATLMMLGITFGGNARLHQQLRTAERASHQILASHPACFAAAARDPEKPCTNPKLRLQVVPTPLEAKQQRNAPCPLIERRGLLYICGFGTPKVKPTIALVGDSHASHWRGAIDAVARTHKWAGVSLSHTGCPLSKATKNLPEPRRSECVKWNQQVIKWFARHPEITTVFVSQISGGAGVVAPGRDQLAAQRAGYRAAWKALGNRRVVVLRDTPKVLGDTDTCVQRAISAHRRADVACRVPRRTALSTDTAAQVGSPVVDLTPFFCDRSYCYPVIGGALVFKDQNHMTETFAKSLAPYVDRSLEPLG